LSPVTIVTDSTTCVPPPRLAEHSVQTVSLYVGWDADLQREDSYTDLDAFYARLRDSPKLPTTSQPAVGDFTACYEPLLAAGHDIVSVHIAGGISGTCDSARAAAETLGADGRIAVFDSTTGAGGLGCLVLAAARAAQRGETIDEVVATVTRARETLDIWFCLDTLEYLRRGGRIGAANALLGTALKIKPILTFGTEIKPVGRVRTTGKALEQMVTYLHELHDRGANAWIVQHAQFADHAADLVNEGRAIFGSEPLFCTEVGPVLGAHLGSGALVGGFELV
jgi:DegV family protein with EDD domain